MSQCNGGAELLRALSLRAMRHHGQRERFENAIPYSCDTFYYTLANRLGIDVIARYATELGFEAADGD